MSSDMKSIDEVKPLVFTQTVTVTCLAAAKGQSVNAAFGHTEPLVSGSEKKTTLFQTPLKMFKLKHRRLSFLKKIYTIKHIKSVNIKMHFNSKTHR